jgi:hypothetical protein
VGLLSVCHVEVVHEAVFFIKRHGSTQSMGRVSRPYEHSYAVSDGNTT